MTGACDDPATAPVHAPEPGADEQAGLEALARRIGRAHLRHRLGMEGEAQARVFRVGNHSLHFEKWFAGHRLLRVALILSGLHARGRRNTLQIQLRHNEVKLPGLPPAFEGYRMLHLSDLHIDFSEEHLNCLIERVRDVPRDACVLTGDFRFHTFGPHEPALRALAVLRPRLGEHVYAVLGNHDSIRMVPGMEALGIRVLLNESVPLERDTQTVWLAGIDDAHYFRAHGLHKAADGIPPQACAILLSHTPEPFRAAAHCGFALILCGHTHGGQICLPGGVPIITHCNAPRAFARGAWRFGSMLGYTSAGCGSSIVDVRLNCLPEVTLHHLRAGEYQ